MSRSSSIRDMETPRNLTKLSDAELVRLAGGGMRQPSERAFEVLRCRYQYRLVGFCSWKCGKDGAREVVQEVVQETWIAVWKRARDGSLRLEHDSSFAKWLVETASNKVREHFRGQRRDDRKVDVLEACARRNDSAPDAAELAVARAEVRSLHENIRGLSPAERETILLRLLEFSDREIAEVRGVGRKGVKVTANRGRDGLFAMLGGDRDQLA